MALPQLKDQFDAAIRLFPAQAAGWPGVSATDLKDSYPSNANVGNDLQAFLYGTNESGFLPRLKKSFELSVGKLEEVFTRTQTLLGQANAVADLGTLENSDEKANAKALATLRNILAQSSSLNDLITALPNVVENVNGQKIELLKPDAENTAFQEYQNNPQILGFPDGWNAMFTAYNVKITERDTLERDFEARRFNKGFTNGAEAFTRVTPETLRAAELGKPYILDFKKGTKWYNLYNGVAVGHLDKHIVPYVMDMQPAVVNNGKVEFSGVRSSEQIDKWISTIFLDVIWESNGNRTNHGWERDLIDASAKQNAISKRLNVVYGEENANNAKITALKIVYDNIFNFRKDGGAAVWSLSKFTEAVRSGLSNIVWKLVIDLRGLQGSLWVGEPEVAKLGYEDIKGNFAQIKAWMEKTNVTRPLPSFFCVSGRNSFWKNPPQGSSNPSGTKPPTKSYLFATTSVDLGVGQNIGVNSATDNAGIPYIQGASNSDFYSGVASWLSFPSLPIYDNLAFGSVNGIATRSSGGRVFEWDVTFPKVFSAVPSAVVWFEKFNYEKGSPLDVTVTVTNITAKTMTVKFEKDPNTKLLDLSIGWFAWLPSLRYHGWTTTVNDWTYNDVNKNADRLVLTGPQHGYNCTFTVPFIAPPQMMLGINRMKFDSKSNIRFQADISFIYGGGYKIRAKSWADTRLFEVGLTLVVGL